MSNRIDNSKVITNLTKVLTNIYRQSAEQYVRKYVPEMSPVDVKENTYVIVQRNDKNKHAVDISIEYFGSDYDYPEKDLRSFFPITDAKTFAGLMDMFICCGIKSIQGDAPHIRYVSKDILESFVDDSQPEIKLGIGLSKDYVSEIEDSLDEGADIESVLRHEVMGTLVDTVVVRDLMNISTRCLGWIGEPFDEGSSEERLCSHMDKVMPEGSIGHKSFSEKVTGLDTMNKLYEAVGYKQGDFLKMFKPKE